MSFYIKDLKIENKVVLAPMAGVSNAVFREIARSCGAGLCFAEMVSDKGLLHKNRKTQNLLASSPNEHPYAQQIFGNDIVSLVKAAKYVNDYTDCDIIDLNMGCPVPKVSIKSQAGAALLKNVDKIFEIVKAIKQVITKPLTVKIRSGWDNSSINAVEVAKKVEHAGADAITIHGRTRSQLYSGKVDLEIIKQVKEAIKIPVIGNGDIKDGKSAKEMLNYTGVDAVMIGRAALGNPWIFKEINEYLKTEKNIPKPTFLEIKEMMIKHYKRLIELKGEQLATLEFRSQGVWYLKGLPQTKETRIKISKLQSKKEFIQIINQYFFELN
ncbi:MAG: tRNA dihydrouridine synthase DusB [Acholeplasmataceae bacterium]|nr:tRNA dihydrouridine synthase DusB [Acholeplasmataceae bacterium]